MSSIDGFVIPVPKGNRELYQEADDERSDQQILLV